MRKVFPYFRDSTHSDIAPVVLRPLDLDLFSPTDLNCPRYRAFSLPPSSAILLSASHARPPSRPPPSLSTESPHGHGPPAMRPRGDDPGRRDGHQGECCVEVWSRGAEAVRSAVHRSAPSAPAPLSPLSHLSPFSPPSPRRISAKRWPPPRAFPPSTRPSASPASIKSAWGTSAPTSVLTSVAVLSRIYPCVSPAASRLRGRRRLPRACPNSPPA